MQSRTQLQTPSAMSRSGHLAVALVNAALLFLLHARPGWQEMSFLTGNASAVLGVVDLALVTGLVLNLLYLVRDPRWLTTAGTVVTTALGIVVMVRLWDVFPFDVADGSGWSLALRTVLVVGIAGAAIGLVVTLAILAKVLRTRGPVARRRREDVALTGARKG